MTGGRRTPNFQPDMSENSESRGPRLGNTGKTNAALRREREAEALRQNLRRRKEQDRNRDAPKPEPGGKPGLDG